MSGTRAVVLVAFFAACGGDASTSTDTAGDTSLADTPNDTVEADTDATDTERADTTADLIDTTDSADSADSADTTVPDDTAPDLPDLIDTTDTTDTTEADTADNTEADTADTTEPAETLEPGGTDAIVQNPCDPGLYTCDSGCCAMQPALVAPSLLGGALPRASYTADGTLHVVYSSRGLVHAIRENGAWSYEPIADWSASNSFFRLALGPDGEPWLLYTYNNVYSRMFLSRPSADGWTLEPVTPNGRSPLSGDIAIDAQGRAHICFENPEGGLDYGRLVGAQWTFATIDATPREGGFGGDPGSGEFCAIALDGDGTVAIAWRDPATMSARVTTGTLGNFTTAIAEDTDHDLGNDIAIAFGPNHALAVAYVDLTEAMVRAALRSGGSWSASAVKAVYSFDSAPSITFDGSGRAVLTAYHGTRYETYMARREGDAWNTALLGGTIHGTLVGDIATRHSITTAPNGKVTAFASGSDEVLAVTDPFDAPVVEVIAAEHDLGAVAGLDFVRGRAITAFESESASFSDNGGAVVFAERRADGSWSLRSFGVPDGAYGSNTRPAVAADAAGNVYLVYRTQRDSGGIGVYGVELATRDAAGTWTSEAVPGLFEYDQALAIALDAQARPHLFFAAPGADDQPMLVEASKATTWTRTTIAAGHVFAVRAVVAAGQRHVVWSDSLAIRYASAPGASTTWAESVIDANPSLGPELAVDRDGAPHVCYSRELESWDDLYLSVRRDGVWQGALVPVHGSNKRSGACGLGVMPDGTVGMVHGERYGAGLGIVWFRPTATAGLESDIELSDDFYLGSVALGAHGGFVHLLLGGAPYAGSGSSGRVVHLTDEPR